MSSFQFYNLTNWTTNIRKKYNPDKMTKNVR